MEEEQWKDVVGYENIYEVSNLGQIRVYHTGQIKKPQVDKDGYLTIHLSKDKSKKHHRIHRLVAKAFIENDNENFKLIDHINRVRTDNRVSNLRWVNDKINSINRGITSRNKSGRIGVIFNKQMKKWRAFLYSDGKEIHGGYFDNFDDAVKKREQLESIYHII